MEKEIEEAAGKYINDDLDLYESLVDGHISYNIGIDLLNKLFTAGAKWQAERMHSEEDMIAIFHYGHQIGMNTILAIQSQHSPQPLPKPDLDKLKSEWFEQFKKK